MRNILLKIEYDGSNYAGWQTQKNAQAIQPIVEAAIKTATGRKANLISSGRTDAGVHAVCLPANFKTDSDMPLHKLQLALNGILPKDIAVKEAKEAPLSFHSRYDAKSKVYTYTILNSPARAAILRGHVYHISDKLNVVLMRREAKCLVGRHNFKSFRAAPSEIKKGSTVRAIKKLKVVKSGDLIKITVEADGFLYNMVRNIVGTLIAIGKGKIKPGSVVKILKARDRNLAGPTAPAKGLCLMEVKY
jgi:tRNA pseudouridine38-40 synthase